MGKVARNFGLLRRRDNRGTKPKGQPSPGGSSTGRELFGTEGEEGESAENDGGKKVARTRPDPSWAPSTSALFKILFSMRLSASLWSVIGDCDEVYNYWEPLHLLLYGRGFQTWEYSPEFAIRSWLYVLLYATPAHYLLLPLFHASSKVNLFFSLRFLIAFGTLLSELALYLALCLRMGNSLGRVFIYFSLFSSAMFQASCAFLPSSFSMVLNAFAMACFLREQWLLAILCTAASALIGWPFAALLGLPIVVEMLVVQPRKLALKFIAYSALSGVAILGLLFTVDSHFFGRPVLAPLNIVLYNVFSPHGPSLYGVEPASFYLRNLLVNFNLALPLAMLALPLGCGLFYLAHGEEKRRKDGKQPRMRLISDWHWHWDSFRPMLLIGLSALLWMAIFLLQPHKEERFLFPIYPHICLLAAFCLDCLFRCFVPTNGKSIGIFLYTAVLATFLLISVSRVFAQHRNYSGIVDVYKRFHDLPAMNQEELLHGLQQDNESHVRLCVGKEWHRFPSSFFLPEQLQLQQQQGKHGVPPTTFKKKVELQFVRSEFRGLLPDHFGQGPTVVNITRMIPTAQNDQNREEPSRYVPVESCHFLIDLEGPEPSELEPNYAKWPSFQSIASQPVLLAGQSDPIHRAFYIPFTPGHKLKFGTLHMLQRMRMERGEARESRV